MSNFIIPPVFCLLLAAAMPGAAFGATPAPGASADATPPNHPAITKIVDGGGCAPKDNMARILKSAHPLDYVPNWSKTNYLGTGWTFMPKRYVVTELAGGIFMQGNLIATRGGTTDRNVFILFSEWDCAG
jgi:hypothetical protein